jgi:hypothetical protein
MQTGSKILRMAASAAILILAPGTALAEVCDKGEIDFGVLEQFPALQEWINTSPYQAQMREILVPGNWITAALLIWLLVSNSVRPAVITLCWFGFMALVLTSGYLSIDLSDQFYQAAISEGCVDPSPRRALMVWLFVAMAGWLTWQRMKRQDQR